MKKVQNLGIEHGGWSWAIFKEDTWFIATTTGVKISNISTMCMWIWNNFQRSNQRLNSWFNQKIGPPIFESFENWKSNTFFGQLNFKMKHLVNGEKTMRCVPIIIGSDLLDTYTQPQTISRLIKTNGSARIEFHRSGIYASMNSMYIDKIVCRVYVGISLLPYVNAHDIQFNPISMTIYDILILTEKKSTHIFNFNISRFYTGYFTILFKNSSNFL